MENEIVLDNGPDVMFNFVDMDTSDTSLRMSILLLETYYSFH